MTSLENLTTKLLMILAKLRNVDDHKNMSRKQLKNILTIPFASKSALRPKNSTPTAAPKSASRGKSRTTTPASRQEKLFAYLMTTN